MNQFFRDLSSEENLSDGREYHAAGIVLSRHSENSESGKDVCVEFLDPFTGLTVTAWRADSDIQVYEAEEFEWLALKTRYEALENT